VLQLEAVLGLGDQASNHLEADNSWGVLIKYLQETSNSWKIHKNTFYTKFIFSTVRWKGMLFIHWFFIIIHNSSLPAFFHLELILFLSSLII
jgi:hypothetical protein